MTCLAFGHCVVVLDCRNGYQRRGADESGEHGKDIDEGVDFKRLGLFLRHVSHIAMSRPTLRTPMKPIGWMRVTTRQTMAKTTLEKCGMATPTATHGQLRGNDNGGSWRLSDSDGS